SSRACTRPTIRTSSASTAERSPASRTSPSRFAASACPVPFRTTTFRSSSAAAAIFAREPSESSTARLLRTRAFAGRRNCEPRGMKRHPAFLRLSRDHHHALVLGRALRDDAPERLRAGLPAEPTALVAHLKARFSAEIESHFKDEDRVLLPLSEARGPL